MLISDEPEAVRLKRGMEMRKAGGYNSEKIVVLDPSDQPIMNRATQVLVLSGHSGDGGTPLMQQVRGALQRVAQCLAQTPSCSGG